MTKRQVARNIQAGRLGSSATTHTPVGKESVTSSASATDDASDAAQWWAVAIATIDKDVEQDTHWQPTGHCE